MKRCAIYTRKSSDEGLDQRFNSLDAQREACEAYVRARSAKAGAQSRALRRRRLLGRDDGAPGLKRLLTMYPLGRSTWSWSTRSTA